MAGHSFSSVRKQKEMSAGSQLIFSFSVSSLRTPTHETVQLTFRVHLTSWANPLWKYHYRNTEICSHHHFKSSQIGSEG